MDNLYLEPNQRLEKLGIKAFLPELISLESGLDEITRVGNVTIYEMCQSLLKSGGKRLRPLLVILCGKALNPRNIDPLISVGMAAELIHMASLIHDDIIDQSYYRRGKPTVNSRWGEKQAVLAGDFLFAQAFDLLAAEELSPVIKIMVATITDMCSGEIDQLNQAYNINLTEKDYFERIEKKTAKLISSCCLAGALVAGANREALDSLERYGTNLGYAFQITDDLLDFTGESSIMGKPSGQDLASGNLTLPVIYLLHHPKRGTWVKNIIAKKQLDSNNLQIIISLLQETGLLEQGYSIAKHCGEIAKNELAAIPPGKYRDLLEHIVDKALERKK